jgi:hypothetical protein
LGTVTTGTASKYNQIYLVGFMVFNGVLSDVDMTSSKFSGSSVGQPSLTVSSLNKNDELFYQCYAVTCTKFDIYIFIN